MKSPYYKSNYKTDPITSAFPSCWRMWWEKAPTNVGNRFISPGDK